MPTCSIHCKDKILKIRNKDSQKRNCLDRSAYSAAVKYANWFWEYMNRSQTHEFGNWDWGRAIPSLGVHKWDSRCSVYIHAIFLAFAVYLQERRHRRTTIRQSEEKKKKKYGWTGHQRPLFCCLKTPWAVLLVTYTEGRPEFSPKFRIHSVYVKEELQIIKKKHCNILPTAESRCPNNEVFASVFSTRNLTFRLIISFR